MRQEIRDKIQDLATLIPIENRGKGIDLIFDIVEEVVDETRDLVIAALD